MTVPTSYSAAQLKSYMITTLTNIATVLSWTTASAEVGEALIDAEVALGVTDIANATDIDQARVFAEVAILERARTALAPLYDVAEDQQDYKRSQAFKAVSEALGAAQNKALRWGGGGYTVTVSRLAYPSADPYAYATDEERVL